MGVQSGSVDGQVDNADGNEGFSQRSPKREPRHATATRQASDTDAPPARQSHDKIATGRDTSATRSRLTSDSVVNVDRELRSVGFRMRAPHSCETSTAQGTNEEQTVLLRNTLIYRAGDFVNLRHRTNSASRQVSRRAVPDEIGRPSQRDAGPSEGTCGSLGPHFC